MTLFWWLFWVAIVALLLATGWPRGRASMRAEDTAIDTLRQRYAAGEIDETEYRERLAVLRGGPRRNAPPPPPRTDQGTHAAA
ncbi:MAG: SHOCT domain-containing protein [Acidobacteriota bacterium]